MVSDRFCVLFFFVWGLYGHLGIKFKPAQYILRLLRYACKAEGVNVGVTKFEICHCVFNDLRCTRDNQDVSIVWNRIKENRKKGITYDQTGDVIRYAGDIIDYMEIANLLVELNPRFLRYWKRFANDKVFLICLLKC